LGIELSVWWIIRSSTCGVFKFKNGLPCSRSCRLLRLGAIGLWVWSSSAAQFKRMWIVFQNFACDHRRIPFRETIFFTQSLIMLSIWRSCQCDCILVCTEWSSAMTAEDLKIDVSKHSEVAVKTETTGWVLEYSPVLTLGMFDRCDLAHDGVHDKECDFDDL